MNIKKAVLHNWKPKLFILISTFFLWVYVSASQSLVINFPGDIPVSYQNTPEGVISVSDVDMAHIKIAVDPINLKQLKEDNFSATIDLKDLSEGTFERPINVTTKNENVKIISVTPPKATVRLEKKITKSLPIRVKLEGQAAEEFVASDTSTDTTAVDVSGPEQIVKSLSEVVAPVKLNGEDESFERSAKLFVYSANGNEIKNVDISPSQVVARISISPSGEAKTVGIKVNTTGAVADGYFISGITTDPAVVTISGSRSLLSKTKFLETETVDINGLSENKSFSAKITVPSGLIVEEKNSQIKIDFEISKIAG